MMADGVSAKWKALYKVYEEVRDTFTRLGVGWRTKLDSTNAIFGQILHKM